MSSQFERTYADFRRNPRLEALDKSCTPVLLYVGSGVVFDGPLAIVSHLLKQPQELTLKEEVLRSHSTQDTLILEVATRLEFDRGPGAYLIGTSANFVADEVASTMIVHIVEFATTDSDSDVPKIKAIRQYWDQASLLKQLKIVGPRGNAWPICTEQTNIVSKAVKITDSNQPESGALTEARKAPADSNAQIESPFKAWPKGINLYDTSSLANDVPIPTPAIEPPRTSAKRQSRTLSQILGGLDLNETAQKTTDTTRIGSNVGHRKRDSYSTVFGTPLKENEH